MLQTSRAFFLDLVITQACEWNGREIKNKVQQINLNAQNLIYGFNSNWMKGLPINILVDDLYT